MPVGLIVTLQFFTAISSATFAHLCESCLFQCKPRLKTTSSRPVLLSSSGPVHFWGSCSQLPLCWRACCLAGKANYLVYVSAVPFSAGVCYTASVSCVVTMLGPEFCSPLFTGNEHVPVATLDTYQSLVYLFITPYI